MTSILEDIMSRYFLSAAIVFQLASNRIHSYDNQSDCPSTSNIYCLLEIRVGQIRFTTARLAQTGVRRVLSHAHDNSPDCCGVMDMEQELWLSLLNSSRVAVTKHEQKKRHRDKSQVSRAGSPDCIRIRLSIYRPRARAHFYPPYKYTYLQEKFKKGLSPNSREGGLLRGIRFRARTDRESIAV